MTANFQIPNSDAGTLLHGDCRSLLRTLAPGSVDMICTDPPYGIGFMGKAWDSFTPAYQRRMAKREVLRRPRSDGRTATGFQGAAHAGMYDHSASGRENFQAFMLAVSTECLRVLKPGGFMFVTMTPRQDCLARMLVAMEDAGFATGFTSLYWAYASGFPKASHIGRAADKRVGKRRHVLGSRILPDIRGNNYARPKGVFTAPVVGGPVSAAAKRLEGAYGGFQPKPAVEVIVVAVKPLCGKGYLDQALLNG